jgi:hypothetical protein
MPVSSVAQDYTWRATLSGKFTLFCRQLHDHSDAHAVKLQNTMPVTLRIRVDRKIVDKWSPCGNRHRFVTLGDTTMRQEWSNAQLRLLKKEFPKGSVAALAGDLGRSEGAVRQKAHSLGLKKKNRSDARSTPGRKKVAPKVARKRK